MSELCGIWRLVGVWRDYCIVNFQSPSPVSDWRVRLCSIISTLLLLQSGQLLIVNLLERYDNKTVLNVERGCFALGSKRAFLWILEKTLLLSVPLLWHSMRHITCICLSVSQCLSSLLWPQFLFHFHEILHSSLRPEKWDRICLDDNPMTPSPILPRFFYSRNAFSREGSNTTRRPEEL